MCRKGADQVLTMLASISAESQTLTPTERCDFGVHVRVAPRVLLHMRTALLLACLLPAALAG